MPEEEVAILCVDVVRFLIEDAIAACAHDDLGGARGADLERTFKRPHWILSVVDASIRGNRSREVPKKQDPSLNIMPLHHPTPLDP